MNDEKTQKPHLSDEAIEMYAENRLPEADLAPFEEHLLVCPSCQDRLDAADRYVSTMREALVRLRAEPEPEPAPKRWFQLPRPVWALAATAAAAVVLMTPLVRRADAPLQPVELAAMRSGASGEAHAGAPLELRLERGSSGLPADVTVEVVDAAGASKWRGPGALRGDRWIASVDRPLDAGSYWVRVYASPDRADLLREFALRVR